MTLKQFGLDGHKTAIEENVALARYLASAVQAAWDLELTAPPALSIVCFRYVGEAAAIANEGALADLNRPLLEQLQLGGEAFLTSTELRGRYTLRACIVNHHSTRSDVDRMLEAVRALGAAYQRK
jgi:aromatic-L-amino-acid decarboxylase